MKFHLNKINLFAITMIFLMLTIFISLGYSINQLSFILDPDNPAFTFEENQFNDDTSFKLLEYYGNENNTVYVSIPKNSTRLYSNISVKGESTPTQTYVTDDVESIAVGDVITSTPENEIAVGARGAVNLLNSTGDELWSHDFSGYYILGVDIGDVNTTIAGNEIAVASDEKYVYLLRASDGSTIWRMKMKQDLRSRLKISYDQIDMINEILLDPDMQVVEDFLGLVAEYGTPEEINAQAAAAHQLPILREKVAAAKPEYLDDLDWLTEQRDKGAFITVADYRRRVLGERADEIVFQDD